MCPNNTITSVAIIGAGAMGAAYSSMLYDAGGFDPYFLVSGERYRKLSGRDIEVNGSAYPIPVKHPDDLEAPADLVIVALKHHHLPDALNVIRRAVGPETIVLSVMNGLESERIIGSACGMEKMVHAIAVGIDAVKEGRAFFYARPGNIIFGAGSTDCSAANIDRLSDALNRAHIPCEVSDDIWRTMWWKFMINVGVNQSSAVMRAPYGVFHASSDARELMVTLMEEVIQLAEKNAINLTRQDIDDWLTILATLGPEGKTSMLQDIEAARKTEVEIFAGSVVAMGEQYGVPTPANKVILHIIKALEHSGNLTKRTRTP